MTLGRAVLVIFFGVTAAVRAADTPLEFSGVLTADGKTRIALTDPVTTVTQWVEPGEEFKGYTVARYDAKDEAVFVKRNGREFRIPLATAKTATAAGSPATLATTNAIRGNLRTLAAAARQYQLERRVTNVSFADLVGPGKFIGELKPVAGENYSTLSFGPDVTAVSVTTDGGVTVALELNPAAGAVAVATSPAASVPPATAAVPAESPSPTGREPVAANYVTQGGETWQKISETTGVPVKELQRLNPAVNGSSLPSGQTIRIR